MKLSRTNRYIVGLCIFLTYTLFAMSWKAGDIIITNYGYDANELSTQIAFLNLFKVGANLLIGILIAKLISAKVFIRNSQMLMASCLLTAIAMPIMLYSDNFALLAASRVLLGISGAFILFSMNPLVSSLFSQDELPIINGLNASAFNVGIALILTLSGLMAVNPSIVINSMSFVAIAVMVLFFFANRDAMSSAKNDATENSKTQATSQSDIDEDNYGVKDAMKSKFNWVFALAFTGVMSFYYIAFTFLDASTVSYMLYAGICGNIVGTIGAKTLKHTTVARVSGVIALGLAIAFMTNLGTPEVKYIAIALGFTMFFMLPSYLTLPFSQPGYGPKQIGLCFMILWVASDFLATFILKVYAFLATSMESQTPATAFSIAVLVCFTIGCFLLKDNSKNESCILAKEN